MTPQDQVAEGLADALLAGSSSADELAARAAEALGRKHRWIRPFARRVFKRFGAELARAQRRELIAFIQTDSGYCKAWKVASKPRIRRYFLGVPRMGPRPDALAHCVLPELSAPADLAAWLGITISELEWYADLRGMIGSPDGALCHYHYKWIPKRHGDYRMIESPKPRLSAIQTRILREILDLVPAHQAAHGFRRGRSCLTHVAPHVGKLVVLRMDLRNFFGSIPAARINALFKTLGYPEETAKYLAGLCTNRLPARATLKIPGADPGFVLPWPERKKLNESHLPQGAPTSPALANLCALHLDFRLTALAGKVNADYTRYADDLAFSGDESVRRKIGHLSTAIAAIALAEGFEVNFRKTRAMHRSDRQLLTGIVINDRLNMQRREYDRLKATLHNCLRFDPDSQNRDGHRDFRAHLLGRVNHLKNLHPQRGARLQALLERIEWQAGAREVG